MNRHRINELSAALAEHGIILIDLGDAIEVEHACCSLRMPASHLTKALDDGFADAVADAIAHRLADADAAIAASVRLCSMEGAALARSNGVDPRVAGLMARVDALVAGDGRAP